VTARFGLRPRNEDEDWIPEPVPSLGFVSQLTVTGEAQKEPAAEVAFAVKLWRFRFSVSLTV